MNSDIPSILIVDSNEAFATMLQESLERDGKYKAVATACGSDALEALSCDAFDLAIVDLGIDEIEDFDGATIARDLRHHQANLRLMVIPLEGDSLPSSLTDLEIQGTLPKPFFLPELPDRIADALSKPVTDTVESSEAPPPDVAPSPTPDEIEPTVTAPASTPEIIDRLNSLSQDINAEAVILSDGKDVIASVGRISDAKLNKLAKIVTESWHTSARVAQILGREQLRFEQSVNGGEHMFYSLAVAEEIILSVASRAGMPLGIIRHRAKQAACALRDMMNIAQ